MLISTHVSPGSVGLHYLTNISDFVSSHKTTGIHLVGTALKEQEATKQKNYSNQYRVSDISSIDFHLFRVQYDSKMYVVVEGVLSKILLSHKITLTFLQGFQSI